MSFYRFLAALIWLLAASNSFGSVVGSVRGVVHDPRHHPLAGANVTLSARTSDIKQSATTNDAGEFVFAAVPLGVYDVTVTFDSFQPMTEAVAMTSNGAPVLHFQLAVATKGQTVEVTDIADEAPSQSATTVVSRSEITRTPGATRTNSLAMITQQVPGAYVVHDQLHVRGGHQVSWLIDGIPVPNTNIASNVGPQFDPKDIDYLEVQRGDYSAEFGDRAYGVFNAVTRSGFERNREAEVVLNYGSDHQTNSQINAGDHTQTFAWYASVSGNRTDVGLETPVPAIVHDMNNGLSGFLSLIWNRGSSDQFRVVTSARNDFYQVPINPADPDQQLSRDVDREHDAFVNAAWVHTSSPNLVFTLAPFYHLNHAAYDGSGDAITPTADRTSQYAGVMAMATISRTRNNRRVGTELMGEHDSQFLGLVTNESALQQRSVANGGVEAAYAEDQFKPFSWLEFNGGLRLTHFHGALSETTLDPRIGAKLTMPKLRWSLHGFYGRYYQPPPLTTVGGPLLDLAAQQGFGFLPLKGERDEQREFGLSIPYRAWLFDITNFQTHARNFFDHDVLGNSNIFFPLTINRARIHGTEISVRSPRVWNRAQWHLVFSRQWAQGAGGVTGGLTDFSPPPDGSFFLDHDQRTTIATGINVDLPWRAWVSANLSYGSGFLDGDGPGHLVSNNTVDIALSKSIGERWTLGLTVVNIADHRFLIDNSNTFGGTHWSEPRQVVGEVRYRFRF